MFNMERKELEKLTKVQLLEKATELGVNTEGLNKNQVIDAILAKEDTPAEDTPAEDTPAEDTPAEDTPAEDTPAEDTPAEDTPAEELDGSSKSNEDLCLRMRLELAKRQSKVQSGTNNTASVGGMAGALQAELAKRSAKFGSSGVSVATDVKTAIEIEARARSLKAAK